MYNFQIIGGSLEDIKLMTKSSLEASFLEPERKDILMKDLIAHLKLLPIKFWS